MRKILLLQFLLLLSFGFIEAQNVGIGTTSPSEKLDVKGNINVTGTIKANGSDGAANQVLMKNGSGVLAWGDMSSYKNFRGFDFTGQFVVPAGVTSMLAEVWGGGGGGNSKGGGGAGGYGVELMTVVPGETVFITVGSGGSFGTASTNGGDGGNSSVSTSTTSGNGFIINGGYGAIALFPGGGGGLFSYNTSAKFYYFPGEAGLSNTESYVQSAAGTFLHIISYGRGGNSPNTLGPTGGKGGYALLNDALGGATVSYQYPSQGLLYGGGGGGGKDNGSSGGYGYVILRW